MKTEKSLKYEGVHEFHLLIDVTCSMAPQFNLVSYYVGEKNTATSDVIALRVQPCFQHKVCMFLSLLNFKAF